MIKITESKFLDKLKIEEINDSTFRVDKPFSYQSVFLQGIVTVPENFPTDFASVPRLPIVYSLFGDSGHMAAVIHDYIYFTALVVRPSADRVFLEAMKASGIPLWKAYPMYLGVRAGGWMAWNAHRKAGHPKKV